MKLTLGFSPCPNDTFIFDALIHNKIDTEGLEFDVFYEDVETLNMYAAESKLDITKLSYFAYAQFCEQYSLLDAGSALGFGVGPMLISRKNPKDLFAHEDFSDLLNPTLRVGIPGLKTTANLLLQTAHPQLQNKQVMLFSDIEQALLDDKIDLGLIIHENRFTYEQKGLFKVQDLGEYWETSTGCAIPLGGIAIKKELNKDLQLKVQRLIRKSVEFAFENPKSALNFIKKHAQEMEENVMYQHINLYVNEYSKSLGQKGRYAINTLFDKAKTQKLIHENAKPDYV